MNDCLRTKILFVILPVFILSGLLISCDSERLDIDVSDINVEIQIKRFEKDLFELDPDNILENIPLFSAKYGLFYELFNKNIINIGGIENPVYKNSLGDFITDPDMRSVYKDCMDQYTDMEDIAETLANAFKHYKYYFPSKPLPEIITFISGFNYNIVTTDSILAIGLDMYLGTDYKYYSMLQLPKYRTNNFHKEAIVPDCLKGWATSEFENNNSKKDLLSQMVYNGKLLYFMDAMLPDISEHSGLKIGYTTEQKRWCSQNESNIWAFFVEQKLLYSTDHSENIKYIGEAPFTPGFPEGSPGRVGQWLGWQIVRAYMNNNPDVSLKELMEEENDGQKILTKSKYKPGK